MPSYIPVHVYLESFGRMYTGDFVAKGGSVVRAVLGDEAVRAAVRDGFRKDAEGRQFIWASVDSADVKIQQLQDVFFAISAGISWQSLSRRWVRQVLSEQFNIDDSDLTLSGLLRRDTREPYVIKRRVDELISERLLRKEGLSGEFRRAVYQLVDSVLEPQSIRADTTPHVLEWLRGKVDRVAYVKPAMLYRKINKTNARQMLASLSRWVRDCGYTGLVVAVDIGAVTKQPKFATGKKYSRSAAMDVYEVIRQFVDATDEVEGLALLITADEAFADDESRGSAIYPALRMRLSDDVWDANRANAMAPMVRLCP